MHTPPPIYFGDMLTTLNAALRTHATVTVKAWKQDGTERTFTDWYVTSHHHDGTYTLYDPLTNRHRRVNEALIFQLQGRKVYW